jgi:hypothetical protein
MSKPSAWRNAGATWWPPSAGDNPSKKRAPYFVQKKGVRNRF